MNIDRIRRSSLTVEAALVMPLFLLACVLCIYLTTLLRCQDYMMDVATRAAAEESAEVASLGEEIAANNVYLKGKLLLIMGEGAMDISLEDTTWMKQNDEIDLVFNYDARLPFSMFGWESVPMRTRVHTRAFTGVFTRTKSQEDSDEIVYITETGTVYHKNLDCTYLKLSISEVLYDNLRSLRNQGGGTFKPCQVCAKNTGTLSGTMVYITNYGDRYHLSRSCSGIKRTIKEIKLSEVGSRHACSKCGGKS